MEIPLLQELYSISDEQKTSFQKRGHVFLKGVASREEVNVYQKIINNVTHKHNRETRDVQDRDTYGKAFLQTLNLWQHNEETRKFTFSRRFAQIAADLLEVEKVRLYHDQSLYKEAGGGITPWHQDQYYWPLETIKTITMWMPLVDITERMGTLTFASGSHKDGLAASGAISDDSERFYSSIVSKNRYQLSNRKTMFAGDATFHHGLTIHGAGPNLSETTREVMTIIYFEDGACVSPPKNEYQENDRVTWLDGLSPGQHADSYLNPILN